MQNLLWLSHIRILLILFSGFYFISANRLYSQSSFDIFPLVPNSDNQAQAWSLYTTDQGFYVLGDMLDTSEIVIPWMGYFDYHGNVHNSYAILDSTSYNPFRVSVDNFYKNSKNNFLLFGYQINGNGVSRPRIIEIDINNGNILRSAFLINPSDSSKNLRKI